MRVERVAVALLLLVSQGALLDVVAMPGGRPKGSKNTAGSHRPGPQSRMDKRRKVDDANANSRRWSSMGFTGQAGDSHPSVQGGGGDGGVGGGGGEGGGGGGGGDSGGFSHGSSSAGEGSSSRGGNSAGGGHDTDGLSDGRGARGATAGVGQVAGVRIVIPITCLLYTSPSPRDRG